MSEGAAAPAALGQSRELLAAVVSAQATLERLEAERDELLAERAEIGEATQRVAPRGEPGGRLSHLPSSELESRLRAVETRLREQLAVERNERSAASAAAAEARATSHGAAAADLASGYPGGAEGASTAPGAVPSAVAAGRLSLCCGGVEFSAPTSPTAPVASAGGHGGAPGGAPPPVGGEMQPPVRAEVALVALPLDFCRWGCGRAVHMQCSLEWRAHRNECVFCGSFWS